LSDAPPLPRWRRRPEARRDELLDAALRLFTERGVAATTVADIAREAGIAKASVYRYFTGRDELLDALVERFYADLLQRGYAASLTVEGSGFVASLEVGMEATIRYLFEQAPLIELLGRQGAPRPDAPGPAGISALAGDLAQAIASAAARGEVSVDDPLATANLLVHSLASTVGHHILFGGELDEERIVAEARRMTRRMLAIAPPPQSTAGRPRDPLQPSDGR
jgi:AcrR family transcriptional regulator